MYTYMYTYVSDLVVAFIILCVVRCSNETRSRPRQLNSPVGKAPSHPGHHGDSEAILGELNVCKSKCQELEKKM